ncbi:alpha/beta family hydrolase [Solibacillus sp. FSL H8-0538]|uniref:alpha/beta family hydrolase n=1 Tax=Solibacillus sp. FSL H8-0538 TaxID=2921400 RepID=UPI0030FA2E56
MKVTSKETPKKIKYTYIENNSKTICFMLSGSNYLYDKPLMYYSKMEMLQNNFDVVQVHYSYEPTLFEKDVEYFRNVIIEEVDSVIEEVLATREYKEIIFLGKSLGTIPISFKYANNNTSQNTKLVLFTPLLKIDGLYENIMRSSNEILMIIGTNDGHYEPNKIREIQMKPNFTLIEIARANHSLDVEPINTTESLKAMTKVNDALHYFIINE